MKKPATPRDPRFKPGDRVTYSQAALEGLLLNVKDPTRVGTVVSSHPNPPQAYRQGNVVRLMWPGRKTADQLHEDYLTKAKEEKPNDENAAQANP